MAICFTRTTPDGKHALTVLANIDCEHAIDFDVQLPADLKDATDALSGKALPFLRLGTAT